jgi:protein farnesyltransferase subunit beta
MLNEPFGLGMDKRTIDFLSRCQDPGGGYGGGPGQMGHLATTYAAVNSLVTIGGEKALASINRDKVLRFLLRMKQANGGFTMHDGGEVDVRGCYTAISVAHILDIMVPEIVENVAEYIHSCQTYEGGIGGEPGAEAHGGYTFCGLAALALIDRVDVINLPNLLNWVVCCQGKVEGGFRGRTNKLVDGCYSFWQGGVFPILQQIMPELNRQQMANITPACTAHNQFVADAELSNEEALRQGSTSASTISEENSDADQMRRRRASGGPVTSEELFPVVDLNIRRAPVSVSFEEVDEDSGMSKEADAKDENVMPTLPSIVDQLLNENEQILYGPLYNSQALQGFILLCCQVLDGGLRDKPGKSPDYYHTCYCLSGLTQAQSSASYRINAPPPPKAVLGPYTNLLEPVHPLCNIDLNKYKDAVRYFKHRPF